MHTWDPAHYLTFADERGRPFVELVGRIGADAPGSVVDLGCGPGNLTGLLRQGWPAAQVTGLDSSPEMVAAARALDDGVTYDVADLREWTPSEPVDVLVSNATLQWVPDHLGLLPRLVSSVRAGGWFAFQVPGNFGEPTHTELAAVRTSPRWQPVLPTSRTARRHPASARPAAISPCPHQTGPRTAAACPYSDPHQPRR